MAISPLPPRSPAKMAAGELVAWTPARMAAAMGEWVMHESQLPAGIASLAVTRKRRA